MLKFSFDDLVHLSDVANIVTNTRLQQPRDPWAFAVAKVEGKIYGYISDGALSVAIPVVCETDEEDPFYSFPCKDISNILSRLTGLSRTYVDCISVDANVNQNSYYIKVYEKPITEGEVKEGTVAALYKDQVSTFKLAKGKQVKETVKEAIEGLSVQGSYTSIAVEELKVYLDALGAPLSKVKTGGNITFRDDAAYVIVANALGIKMENSLKDVLHDVGILNVYGDAISAILGVTRSVEVLEYTEKVNAGKGLVDNGLSKATLYFKNDACIMKYMSSFTVRPDELKKFNYNFDTQVMLDKPYLQDVLRRVEGDDLFVEITFNGKDTKCVLQTNIGKFVIPVMDAKGEGTLSLFMPTQMFSNLIMNHIKYDIASAGGESVIILGFDTASATDSQVPVGALSGSKVWTSVCPRVARQVTPQF